MGMRHAGYAVRDKNGELSRDGNCNLVFDIEEETMRSFARFEDKLNFPQSPHKVVRVIIDDLEEEEK